MRDRGDKEAIAKRRDELSEKIASKREENEVSEEDAKAYENVVERLGKIEGRVAGIDEETQRLSAYVRRDGGRLTGDNLESARHN